MTSFKNSHTHVKHNTLVFFLASYKPLKTVTAYFQYFNYFLLVVFSFSTEQRHNGSTFNFFFLFLHRKLGYNIASEVVQST